MANQTATAAGPRPNIISFTRGQEILAEGATADYVFIILTGKVSLWREGQRLQEISAQDVIGLEGQYNRSGTYPYTAQAEAFCRVARYPVTTLSETLAHVPRLTELMLKSVAKQLDNCWLKMAQPQMDSEDTYFTGEVQTFSPGEWVINEGEDSTEFYRIISADKGLEVSKGDQVLAILKEPGEFFGEMASLLGEKRTASIKSLGMSVLEVYPAEQLIEILTDYPELSMRMIQTLVRRLAETTKALAAAGKKSA